MAKMRYVTHDPIDVTEWHRLAIDQRDGAAVEFLGLVRGEEQGQPIQSLWYEAYEPMAERVIERVVKQVREQWPLHTVCVRHRVGRVAVGEVALLIGVRSPHRDEAFEACRFLIDAIKRDVPIWKAAISQDGRMLQPTCADGHATR
jgi:molybdopterin synthase catalytic subunit